VHGGATTSEQWFDDYLVTNGYSFEVEPDMGIPTRPDRLIERVGIEAFCEIKEFTTDAPMRRWPEGGRRIGSFSTHQWLLNIRRAISDAASQLELLAEDGRPLVIVLANPHGVLADLRGGNLIEAMYGDMTVTFRINPETGEPASEPEWVLGDYGRLAGEQASWVSAVAGLQRGNHRADWERNWVDRWIAENWPDEPTSVDEAAARSQATHDALAHALTAEDAPSGEYFYLHVVEAVSDEAAVLPREVLDGEHDNRWAFNEETRFFELLE
jgi:hypothetical protein